MTLSRRTVLAATSAFVTEPGGIRNLHGPNGLSEFTRAELAHWGEVIGKAGITLDE